MKMYKGINRFVIVLMMVVCLWIPSISAYAEEAVTELSTLMAAQKAVDAYAEPSEQSEVVFSYEKDSHVLVTGETASGWYRVAYQEQVGFVKKADLKETELNIAALDEEFAANEIDGKIFVEEVERIRAQITRSRIWGTIIVVLIVGIFGTGIYSTIKSEKKKKQEEALVGNVGAEQESVVAVETKELKKSEPVDNEDELIEPLSFDTVEMPQLDMIDLDKQEL